MKMLESPHEDLETHINKKLNPHVIVEATHANVGTPHSDKRPHIKIRHSFMIMRAPYIKIRNILIDMSKPHMKLLQPRRELVKPTTL